MSPLAAERPDAGVRQLGDPVLRAVCEPVARFDDALAAQAEQLLRICEQAGGVGLAAPQAGRLCRMFVMAAPDEEPLAIVNPRLVSRGSDQDWFDEGCLSLALGRVLVPVRRPTEICVVYADLGGAEREERLGGFTARIFQHELDHLDGVLIIDRTGERERRGALGLLRVR